MNDPVANYHKAMTEYEAAVEKVKDLREVLSPVDLQIRDGWAHLKVDNYPGFRPSIPYSAPATGAHIDARKWPNIDQIVSLLNAAHDALSRALAAWSLIPVEQRVGRLSDPPM